MTHKTALTFDDLVKLCTNDNSRDSPQLRLSLDWAEVANKELNNLHSNLKELRTILNSAQHKDTILHELDIKLKSLGF